MSHSTINTFLKYTTLFKNPLILFSLAALVAGCYFWIDLPVATFFYALHPQEQAPWLVLFTDAGKAYIYVALFIVLLLFFRYVRVDVKKEMQLRFLLLCVLIPNVICLFLKTLSGRARPELWFSDQQYGFYGIKLNKMFWSFPSSHASTVMGLMIGCCILFPRYKYFFVIAGVLIMVSRIILFQHFVSDILAAIILTMIEIGLLVYFLRKRGFKDCLGINDS